MAYIFVENRYFIPTSLYVSARPTACLPALWGSADASEAEIGKRWKNWVGTRPGLPLQENWNSPGWLLLIFYLIIGRATNNRGKNFLQKFSCSAEEKGGGQKRTEKTSIGPSAGLVNLGRPVVAKIRRAWPVLW